MFILQDPFPTNSSRANQFPWNPQIMYRLRKYVSAKYPKSPPISANIFIARRKSASYLFDQPINVQEKLGMTEKEWKHVDTSAAVYQGPSKGVSKSRFHAGFLHKSRQEIAWNSCSRQVYPIALDARLIFHAITQLFSSNSRFHALKYVESRHHPFALGGRNTCSARYYSSLKKLLQVFYLFR